MSKTFEQIVQETLAATQAQNRMLAASTGSSPSTRIFRHALAAFEVAREPDPAPELVARIVDAVRVELAGEESAPAAPVGCGIPSVKVGASVTTKPRSPGSTFDRWGRRVGTRGVVLTAPQTSTGGDVVSVRLEDGSVLPYPVDSLETEAPAAEVAVSVTGLRGSPARVAAELRQLAERVESGWLGTSSASGCDVLVKLAGEPGSAPGGA